MGTGRDVVSRGERKIRIRTLIIQITITRLPAVPQMCPISASSPIEFETSASEGHARVSMIIQSGIDF